LDIYYLGKNDLWPRKKGLSLKSDAAPSKSKRRKKPDNVSENQEVQAIGGKDVSLFLFRALGKILYCKSKKLYGFFFSLLDISLTTEVIYHIS
jgi:cell cycle checkpoint protein